MVVLDELRAQAQPRDRRAQVVADRGQHLRAVVDQAPHPVAHPVEGAGDGEDLLRAGLGQGDVVVAGAERLGRAGEPRQRRRQRPGRPDAEQGQGQRQEHDGEDQRALLRRAQRVVRQASPGAARRSASTMPSMQLPALRLVRVAPIGR